MEIDGNRFIDWVQDLFDYYDTKEEGATIYDWYSTTKMCLHEVLCELHPKKLSNVLENASTVEAKMMCGGDEVDKLK